MVRGTLSYKGLWLSPSFVIHRMQKIIEKLGVHEANSSGCLLEAINDIQTVRLYPTRLDAVFDFPRAVQRSENQKEIMRPGNRGTGTNIYSLGGDVYLPIP